MIRALLYRLLIISAHLQRHGIRLLIAIGRFNARAARFALPQPFRRQPFDSGPSTLPSLPFHSFSLSPSLPPHPASPPAVDHASMSLARKPITIILGRGANGPTRASAEISRRLSGKGGGGRVGNGGKSLQVSRKWWSRARRGRAKIGGGSVDSRNESEIAARLIKSELHSTGVYTPTAVRWGSTSITVAHHR